MDNIKDLIIFAVSIILCCAVLSMVGVLGNVSNEIAAVRENDILSKAALIEYEKMGHLDGKIVTGADVISIIRENTVTARYEVRLKIDDTTYTMNSTNAKSDQWSLSKLSKLVSQSRTFHATIIYGAANNIEGVAFW